MRRSTARRAATFGSAALLILASTGSLAAADPAPGPDPAIPGLPAELVAAVSRDLHLTADQYMQRADLAQRLAVFAQTARTQFPESFAGAWLDETGRAVVALAPSAQLETASALVEGAGFDVKSVATNEAGLRDQKSAFDAWLATQPVEIADAVRAVAIDVVNNSIAVRVDNVVGGLQLPNFLAPARIVTMPNPLAAEPLGTTTDVAGELPRNALAGGDSYASSSDNGGLRCSLGFNATNGAGEIVNVTAGHCDPNRAAAGTPDASVVYELGAFDAVGARLGTFAKTSLDNHDYAIIRVGDDQRDRFDNNIVRIPGQTPLAIDGIATPVVGAPVCKSGARTGFSCGVVDAVDQSVEVGDRKLNDAFSVTICALPGDSGGTIVTGSKALGVSSASSVAEYPICEIPNIIGPALGNPPMLFATTLRVVLDENPGLRIHTS